MTDTAWMTASEIAAAVAAKKVSARAVVEQALARIADRNPVLNAFTEMTAARALARADAVDAGRARGPLAGVPFAVGREAAATYNESFGGRLEVPNKLGGHQFNIPLNYTWPNGTLLPGIYAGDPGAVGAGDGKVQVRARSRLCQQWGVGYDRLFSAAETSTQTSTHNERRRTTCTVIRAAAQERVCPAGQQRARGCSAV